MIMYRQHTQCCFWGEHTAVLIFLLENHGLVINHPKITDETLTNKTIPRVLSDNGIETLGRGEARCLLAQTLSRLLGSRLEKEMHVKCFELLGKNCGKKLSILLKLGIDTISYIKKMGGAVSPQLNKLTKSSSYGESWQRWWWTRNPAGWRTKWIGSYVQHHFICDKQTIGSL